MTQQVQSLAEMLRDPALLRLKNLVGGIWTAAASERRHPVINPSTGCVIAEVPYSEAQDAHAAVTAAHAAFPAWSAMQPAERATLLKRWRDLIVENKDDLGTILAWEQGKPIKEAIGEVVYGASFVEWFAEEGKRIYGDVIPSPAANKRIVVIKQPVGVVGLITPWNFPSAMITRKAGPSLAAGCTVVLKPAEHTPLSALALGELALRAGIPPGVFNVVVTGDPAPIGDALTFDPRVRKISFTGSTRVGKLLMAQCAQSVKKVSLELGGNAAFIVFDDADLDSAVAGLMAVKFRNAGQTCISANRIYVHRKVYEEFAAKLTVALGGLVSGNPLDPAVSQGPLINRPALAKVDRLVSDAVQRGATVLAGGKPHALGGLFYEPTILTRVPPDAQMWHEEIFGPIVPLASFDSEDEVVASVNNTPYGLANYFYSRDIGRAWRVAERLESGMVGVNESWLSTEVAPFGGVKESGIGREGSKYGILDYVETKYVCFGGI
nr:NAD-dependent succinate-semialdehyde dehydrogenase [Noviherbaspirillum denitrificans]